MTEKNEGPQPETPMNAQIVIHADLVAALTALATERAVIAPVDDRAGAVFAPIEEATAIRLNFRNTTLSPKAAVFPQVETLLSFREGIATETIPEPPETVLFGVRPCDARALTMLGRVFQRDGIDDPYVAARRDRLTVIALALCVFSTAFMPRYIAAEVSSVSRETSITSLAFCCHRSATARDSSLSAVFQDSLTSANETRSIGMPAKGSAGPDSWLRTARIFDCFI